MSLPLSNNVPTGRVLPARGLARATVPALACIALATLGGCSSTRTRPEAPPQPVQAPAPAAVTHPLAPGTTAASQTAAPASGTASNAAPPAAGGAAGAGGAAAGETAGTGAAPAPRPEVPPEAQADFTRAVNLMRAGNSAGAEVGFRQIAQQYPQFAAPWVNLGILYRNAGHLDQAEQAQKTAVEHEPGSAVAWTELGVTQRLRGEFKDAASSDEQAIKADPQYAPAWRNLGVVSDLYLGDPQRALTALTRYRELTGEDKPVGNWIAELRQRLGLPPVKKPQAAPTEAAPPAAPSGAPSATPQTPPATTVPSPNPAEAAGSGGG
jgi:Flp pilus assembly protein TadD